MQNFARRLMSGASLALLAFGAPSIARASSGFQVKPGVSSAANYANSQIGSALGGAEDTILIDEGLIEGAFDTATGGYNAAYGHIFGNHPNAVPGAVQPDGVTGTIGVYTNAVAIAEGGESNVTHLGGHAHHTINPALVSSTPLHHVGTHLADILDISHPGFAPATQIYNSCCHNTFFGNPSYNYVHVTKYGPTQTGHSNIIFDTNHHRYDYGAYAHNAWYGATATAKAASQQAHNLGGAAGNLVYVSASAAFEAKASAYRAVSGNAHAYAQGIDQIAIADTEASNFVSNDGGFVGAIASAHDAYHLASARATAVRQYAAFATSDTNLVGNEGKIVAYANEGSAHTGHAHAVGVLQDPIGSKYVLNSVTNAGLILAVADAHYNVTADATAIAISQEGEANVTAHNVVKNYESGVIVASAYGYGNDHLDLHATAVKQNATAPYADNTVQNSGLIAAGAFGDGDGHTNVYATARGVYQNGETVSYPTNIVKNAAGASIVALARASDAYHVGASATAVLQSGDAVTAHNSATNHGYIAAAATAHNGHTVAAHAHGVDQIGTAIAHVDNTVVNYGTIVAFANAYSGIHVAATAQGVEQSGYANNANNYVDNTTSAFIGAKAVADSGFYVYGYAAGVGQYAEGTAGAQNVLDNYGVVEGVATATKAEYATAEARGIYQSAYANGGAKNTVTNHGFIGGSAYAYKAYRARATAAGISQYASAANGKATQAVVNYTHADVVGFAQASGARYATATAEGVFQSAYSALTAVNKVTNHGLIGGWAQATGNDLASGHAYASAEGILQVASASKNVHNTVNNYGSVVALADARYARYVSATAAAIKQTANGTGASVAGNFAYNAGVVYAEASAKTAGTYFHHGSAHAYATGIAQSAHGAATAQNTVTNFGDIVAVARATNAKYNDARAAGVYQSASSAATAKNGVLNAGVIVAEAVAHGDGLTAATIASAKAYGVDQHADPSYAYNTVTNHGTIVALASANGASQANALAKGVNQAATAVHTADNYASNAGYVWAQARASGNNTNLRHADATAYGVDQYAYSTSAGADNDVVNHKDIVALATAADAYSNVADARGVDQTARVHGIASNTAENYGLIFASANAYNGHHIDASARGVAQSAEGNTSVDATSAFNHVTNHAGATIGAMAHASHAHTAYATAHAVTQYAHAYELAKNSVSNAGHILASATVYNGYSGNANAVGVAQYARAETAENAVDNHGVVAAYASASYGRYLDAHATGIDQRAYGSTKAADSATNAGMIVGAAKAHGGGWVSGTLHPYYADAYASGVEQGAYATTHASNKVVNDSGAVIAGVVTATGARYMYARAYGMYQSASADGVAGVAKNTLTNNGLVAAFAKASSHSHASPHYDASAFAYAVDQSAYAVSATNKVVNDGAILAFAEANHANYVHAAASAIFQSATGSANHNTVDNTKDILAIAEANHGGTGVYATAYAAVQYADGDKTGINQVTNSGLVGAIAVASGATRAGAFASGVYQQNDPGVKASNLVYNHGTIAAIAEAHYDYNGNADAVGVYQSATGTGAAVVNNVADNYRHIVAVAGASGTHNATAKASAVHQFATGSAGKVENDIYNSGVIAAGASALAGERGKATAYAIDQSAYGSALAQNYVENYDGQILAFAHAFGGESNANADAYGVYQSAAGHTAKQTVLNIGYHTTTGGHHVNYYGVIAASANATGDLDVSAYAAAVSQNYVNGHTAKNHVTNEDGLILAKAAAHGSVGVSYTDPARTAFAEATAVYQDAEGHLAYNFVYNTGTIVADAQASHAYRYATASAYGVRQYADGTGSGNYATNLVENYGGHVLAHASAHGGTSSFVTATTAKATAEGVKQDAYGVHAENQVVNTGHILASAAASNAAYDYAYATGVNQYADLVPGLARNYVTNLNGVIAARATAHNALHFTSSGGFASASAYGAYQDAIAVTATNNVYNHITGNHHATIAASAHAYDAATASARAYGVYQHASGGLHANNYVDNSAGAMIAADASAHNAYTFRNTGTYTQNSGHTHVTYSNVYGGLAQASATAIGQHANDASGHAYDYVYNHGDIFATAVAHDAHTAIASGYGIDQVANGLNAQNKAVNYGLIDVHARATDAPGYTTTHVFLTTGGAHHTTHTYIQGSAYAQGVGVAQTARGHHAENTVTNNGLIEVYAYASNDSKDLASASAIGVEQYAHSGTQARNTVDQGGTLVVHATVRHASSQSAFALGIGQAAFATKLAFNDVANDGYVGVDANAYSGVAYEDADAIGIAQFAGATHTAVNDVYNYGWLTVNAVADKAASASATATGVVQFAFGKYAGNYVSNTFHIGAHAYASASKYAGAFAHGVAQVAIGSTAVQGVYNSGTIVADAGAFASATASAKAVAQAGAFGVSQHFGASHAYVTDTNDGYIRANAYATVSSGKTQKATAYATGVIAKGYAKSLDVDIVNNGHITASAFATVATGTGAHAHADGVIVANSATGAGHGDVYGTIRNRGYIGAEASAYDGHATAIGIGVRAKTFNGYIVNSGTIDAQAFGAHHSETGIGVENNGKLAATAAVGHVTNNGGMIFASGGNYETGNIHHIGNAINVSNAPNEVDINLEGVNQTGQIFGNIEDAAAGWNNKITVKNGTTYLDGSINPGLGTLANGGTLSVSANGTLWVADAGRSFWGAAPVLNVDNYSQAGTLRVGVTYGAGNATINAVSASLGGNLIVDLNPYVLFNNSSYNIVNAGTVSGTWSTPVSVVDGPVGTGSPLVSAKAIYTGTTAGVDLMRAAFYAPLNVTLTSNEKAVGHGLENAYSTSLTGGAKDFYLSLFQFNSTQYPQALNMLSDSQAGVVAQSNVVSASGFVDRVQDRMSSMAAIGQSAAGPKGITLWVTPFGTWTNTSSNASGPGYSDSRAGASVGADVWLDGTALLVGIAGNIEGKGSFQFKDNDWNTLTGGGSGSSSGWDIAGYARYTAPPENDSFYLQGSVSYGTYDNTTNRVVTLPLLAPQTALPTIASPSRGSMPPYTATTISTPSLMSGAFTSNVWSVHGEAGLPVDLGDPNFGFTPFVAVRYLNSSSGTFSEKSSNATPGVAAAALNVTDASASTLETYLGTQLSSQITMGDGQMLMPSLRLAWAHNFEDPWKVRGYFQGLGPTSAFEVNSSTWSRDSGLADLAVSMAFQGNLMATIGYSANFGSTQTSQSVYGRLDVKF